MTGLTDTSGKFDNQCDVNRKVTRSNYLSTHEDPRLVEHLFWNHFTCAPLTLS